MKNRKLLFFDIDGTLLLEETQTIPKSAIKAMQKAKKKGHLIFINTGRPYAIINQCIKDLEPDGYICGCGTYIQFQNQILFSKTLPKQRCQQIVQLARQTKVDIFLEGTEAVYFDASPRHPFLHTLKQRCLQSGFVINNFDSPQLSFDKFSVWFDTQADIQRFRNQIDDFEYIEKGADLGEAVPWGCSKSMGIQFLADYFQASLQDCYVFCDSATCLHR